MELEKPFNKIDAEEASLDTKNSFDKSTGLVVEDLVDSETFLMERKDAKYKEIIPITNARTRRFKIILKFSRLEIAVSKNINRITDMHSNIIAETLNCHMLSLYDAHINITPCIDHVTATQEPPICTGTAVTRNMSAVPSNIREKLDCSLFFSAKYANPP